MIKFIFIHLIVNINNSQTLNHNILKLIKLIFVKVKLQEIFK